MTSGRVRFLLTLAGVTILYVLAGKLGLSLAFVNASTTAVWPPAGIAVAALLLIGLRAWPAVAAGAFLVNVTTSIDVLASLAIAGGNTLECVAAAALATRFARGRYAFERGPDVLRFTLLSALAAPMIAATVGTAALRFRSLAPPDDSGSIWLTWWLGDATGIVLFAPLCVLAFVRPAPLRGGRVEGFTLGAGLVVVLSVVFGTSSAYVQDLLIVFLMVPILLWSAFRFGPWVTSIFTVATSVIAVYRTLHQFGPFTLGGPAESLLVVQAFVGLLAVLMLAVAGEVHVRHRIEAEMRALNETLERRVAIRTEEVTRVHDRLVEAQAVAHVGSWEWNLAADSLWWSDEMCRVFGVTQPPADYAEYLLRVHPDDRDRTDGEVRLAAAAPRPFSFEHRIIRPDGDVRVLQARGRIEMDAGGRPLRMIGIGHDITERKQAEEQHAQLIREQAARREAEEANRAKDTFLAMLSHELRTPLNAALGWAHTLRESSHAGEHRARALEAIYRNLLIQSRLVSDILDASQIARGRLPLEREMVDVSAAVAAAIEMVDDDARAKQVRIDVHTTGAPIVTGDSRRLQQVAWNLLSNAVKFASENGRVRVSLAARPDAVELSIEDDGPGIAPAFLPHVFEEFRQGDASLTREHGGLGLGLTIAHHIVESHHGTIEARNHVSGGAVFVVRLPPYSGSMTAPRAAQSAVGYVEGADMAS